mmetsp:Transcript_13367/g.27278  ORF Transcript_13367/g.27278 Transcript_13367/m.27278 type:complete len:193 (+) Transcript_13367:169-747(+)
MEPWTQIHWSAIFVDVTCCLLVVMVFLQLLRRLIGSLLKTLPLFGLILSVYALHVESNYHRNSGESALCDIELPFDIVASCTKTLTSPESHVLSYLNLLPHGSTLDVPNAFLGVLFYASLLLLPHLPLPSSFKAPFVKFAATAAFGMTVYLGATLYRKRDVCLLCITTHIINTFIWFTSGSKEWTGGKRKVE